MQPAEGSFGSETVFMISACSSLQCGLLAVARRLRGLFFCATWLGSKRGWFRATPVLTENRGHGVWAQALPMGLCPRLCPQSRVAWPWPLCGSVVSSLPVLYLLPPPFPTSTRYFFVSFSQVCVCCLYHTRFVLAVFLGMGKAGQSATCFLETFEGSCTDSLESGLVAGGVPVGCGNPRWQMVLHLLRQRAQSPLWGRASLALPQGRGQFLLSELPKFEEKDWERGSLCTLCLIW